MNEQNYKRISQTAKTSNASVDLKDTDSVLVLTTIINNVLFKDVTINIYLEFSGNKIVVAIILVHRWMNLSSGKIIQCTIIKMFESWFLDLVKCCHVGDSRFSKVGVFPIKDPGIHFYKSKFSFVQFSGLWFFYMFWFFAFMCMHLME